MKTWMLGTLLLVTTAAWAEPIISIHADASPREVYIGDQIGYAVVVLASSGTVAPPIRITSWGEFELLQASTPTVLIGKDGSVETDYKYLLTIFSTGTFNIPALEGVPNAVGIPIRVKSLIEEKGDEGNLRPLKGLFNFRSYLWLWILLGSLALGAAGYFLWKHWQRRGVSGPLKPAGPPRPPEELAWEALHELEDADLINTGQAKEFYFRLSIILREYLERRYGFSALDRTTSELLQEFRQRNFSQDLMQLCRAFFDSADLVKFAKFTPTEDEVLKDLNLVKQFVNLSTPQKAATEDKVKI